MKNKSIISILLVVITSSVLSQSAVNDVLSSVEANNKSIQSNKKYWEARRAEFKTGLTPYDPQVEYDYLFGSPAFARNQVQLFTVICKKLLLLLLPDEIRRNHLCRYSIFSPGN